MYIFSKILAYEITERFLRGRLFAESLISGVKTQPVVVKPLSLLTESKFLDVLFEFVVPRDGFNTASFFMIEEFDHCYTQLRL